MSEKKFLWARQSEDLRKSILDRRLGCSWVIFEVISGVRGSKVKWNFSVLTSRILCKVQLAGDLGEDRLGQMEGSKRADEAPGNL